MLLRKMYGRGTEALEMKIKVGLRSAATAHCWGCGRSLLYKLWVLW